MRVVLLILLALAFAACSGKAPAPDIAQVPSVDGAQIENVLTRVKQEVGLFYSDGAKSERNWTKLISDLDAHPVCGDGHIAFYITSVKMDFSVIDDKTAGLTGGLKIPFGPSGAGGSISPGVGGSRETTGNIDLAYIYKPLATGPASDDYNNIRNDAVILPALDKLRNALIRATGHKPCFNSLGKADPDQTLVFSVEVKQDFSSSLGFNFYLVSLSGTKDAKNTGNNTITVSYRPIKFGGGEKNLLALHRQLNLEMLKVNPALNLGLDPLK